MNDDTGTDHVELTDDEREAWAEYAHAHGMHVDFWRDTRNGFIDGLRIQAARVQALTAERDEWKQAAIWEKAQRPTDLDHIFIVKERDELAARLEDRQRDEAADHQRIDALRAELAAANTRCAELEALVKDSMSDTAVARGKALDPIIENAALQATLDRVTAAIKSSKHKTTDHEGTVTGYLISEADLRAALAPEGSVGLCQCGHPQTDHEFSRYECGDCGWMKCKRFSRDQGRRRR